MNIILVSIIILALLAVSDLMVGVSNDAVNFLNSSIGSRVAPRYVIMIIASLGILAGVTFSSGMMEVARKGIFHPRFFSMPELVTVFLAVMLTDILLLDLFNTFGLPTSTTVSIVFELLGAAVAVSLIKIADMGGDYNTLVHYINTGKALAIISGILLSIIIAFICGAVAQFLSRLVFTFDYKARLKRYGGLWGGLALSMITYFILIKGAKGTSFLTPEAVAWIKTHAWTLLMLNFLIFSCIFQLLILFSRINILKPIVLVGTFALAMAFAANDLVNFIGVPLASLEAYKLASAGPDPLNMSMEALAESIPSNTFLLLGAGAVMVLTLWVSKKARSVTRTEVSLGSQDEGIERFGSFFFSRVVVGMASASADILRKMIPRNSRRFISKRLDTSFYKPVTSEAGKPPSFDLLRASVNLMVASAVVSYATSHKLPLSTTYVTFMVAMGTSLSDQAWGKESAVYRITGVMTVIGGWFCTALIAFTVSGLFATAIHYFRFPAVILLTILAGFLILKSFRYHSKREEIQGDFEVLRIKDNNDAAHAIDISFEQTGKFLNEVSCTIREIFDSIFSEDRQRMREIRNQTKLIQNHANIIIANVFKALYLIEKGDVETSHKYSKTIGALQEVAESLRDIAMRAHVHLANYHSGLLDSQKEELKYIRIATCRLLENTAIMILKRKKIDFDYIDSQCTRLNDLVREHGRNQVIRIQNAESKTRLSILFYGFIENCEKIALQTCNLLEIFRASFRLETGEDARTAGPGGEDGPDR